MNQQLTGFSDANKFRIINSVPYFNCPGNSYLDKLKNIAAFHFNKIIKNQK